MNTIQTQRAKSPALPCLVAAGLALLMSACGQPATTSNGSGEPAQADRETVLLRNTYYLLAPESLYPLEPKDSPVYSMSGELLAMVNSGFKKRLDLEGSGKLVDGRVLNFNGRDAEGKVRYAFTVHPFGRGVGNCPLIPYHTAAVDPKVVPLGSVIRIKETVGMLLPDGTRSDGLWRAEDIGGAIKGDRIDLFVGTDIHGVYLDKAGITHLQALTAQFVSKPAGKTCVDEDPL